MNLDKNTVDSVAAYLTMANAPAFLEDESEYMTGWTGDLWDFVEDKQMQTVLWVMRDKQIHVAQKSLAEASMNQVLGAVKRKDNLAMRKYLSEGVNDILRVSVGPEAYNVILENIATPTKMIKDYESLEREEIALLMAATGRSIRKELTRNGLYSGPID